MKRSNNNLKIAFFDSGIGGLTVLHEALKLMPNEQYIYFADSENTPYGTKPTELVKELVFDAVDFLMQKDIKALVLACNTATSVAIKDLRQKYTIPIIGMEPAVKPAVELAQDKKTVVCATDKTLAESKLQTLIQNLHAEDKVEKLSLQQLVLFAEKFQFDGIAVETYLKEQFSKIHWQDFNSIVLGCTHFPFFKPLFQKLLPAHVRILDGNLGTVKYLQKQIIPTTKKEPSEIEYFASGKKVDAANFQRYFGVLQKV